MSDEIRVRGLRVFAHHGVFEHERINGQYFFIDIDARTSFAGAADDIDRTLHYGDMCLAVVAAVETEPVDLIETVAERVAAVVLRMGADSVRVEVHKPDAPVPADFQDISVVIDRSRS
ncbi:MAG: hypothetical protein RIS25_1236 [Actinomycetota bacterium]|jgi:dihydroneopterin aldolase